MLSQGNLERSPVSIALPLGLAPLDAPEPPGELGEGPAEGPELGPEEGPPEGAGVPPLPPALSGPGYFPLVGPPPHPPPGQPPASACGEEAITKRKEEMAPTAGRKFFLIGSSVQDFLDST